MTIDERVRELGLVLSQPFRSPTGVAAVINGLSSLILEVFANERGAHSRSA